MKSLDWTLIKEIGIPLAVATTWLSYWLYKLIGTAADMARKDRAKSLRQLQIIADAVATIAQNTSYKGSLYKTLESIDQNTRETVTRLYRC